MEFTVYLLHITTTTTPLLLAYLHTDYPPSNYQECCCQVSPYHQLNVCHSCLPIRLLAFNHLANQSPLQARPSNINNLISKYLHSSQDFQLFCSLVLTSHACIQSCGKISSILWNFLPQSVRLPPTRAIFR